MPTNTLCCYIQEIINSSINDFINKVYEKFLLIMGHIKSLCAFFRYFYLLSVATSCQMIPNCYIVDLLFLTAYVPAYVASSVAKFHQLFQGLTDHSEVNVWHGNVRNEIDQTTPASFLHSNRFQRTLHNFFDKFLHVLPFS